MKITGVLLIALMSVLAMSARNVYGAILEIPDEWLDSARVVSVERNILREKRQVKISGRGSEHRGLVKIDGQKELFNNGKTKVDGKVSYENQYAKGMRPQHGVGVGAEITHNVWKGRNGQTLDVGGSYKRDWYTGPRPNNHQLGVIMKYRF